MNVAVIGGGIAGLATAFSLFKRAAKANLSCACTLFEASERFGGKIRTEQVDGFVVEGGPDSFLSHKPWGVELCRELGLHNRLMGTNPAYHKTYVLYRGHLQEFPEGLVTMTPQVTSLLGTRLLSWPGKLRMGMEFMIKRPVNPPDESLSSFFRRRFGGEAFEKLLEPLMTGIYAGNAEQLSLQATFPRFRELEQQYGSITKGLLAGGKGRKTNPGGPPAGLTTFVTLRGGLTELVRALVEHLRDHGREQMCLLAGCAVSALLRTSGKSRPRYEIRLEDARTFPCDAVAIATPAYSAADLLTSIDETPAQLLRRIPYTSTATVSLAYTQASLSTARPLNGFGFIVPRIEGRLIMASTWTSTKWLHRSPSGHVLLRCYLGGVGREEVTRRDERDIVRVVREELREIVGITAEPVFSRVFRWVDAIPQYLVGHLDRVAEIERALSKYPGLFLTGSAYRGVGIPDCIRDGDLTAEKIVAYLRGETADA